MNSFVDMTVLLSSYMLYFYLYGSLVIAIESLNDCVGLCSIGLPLVIFVFMKFLAIPRPNEDDVKSVLGVDIWQQYKQSIAEKNNENDNAVIESSDLSFRTIAHRSAGLDAPENSISALKTVSKLLFQISSNVETKIFLNSNHYLLAPHCYLIFTLYLYDGKSVMFIVVQQNKRNV